jgi:hypothetical protein
VALSFTTTFDATDPGALATFWAAALDYQLQPPPEGFSSWDTWCDSMDIPVDDRNNYAAIIDPETSRRLLFLKVPETKSAKNRVHLDVSASSGLADELRSGAREAHAESLEGFGATIVARREEYGASWIVMEDPEGNVFCVT